MRHILLRRFTKETLAIIGLFVLAVFVLAAIFAPFITPVDPNRVNPREMLRPPSSSHWMGADDIGRDVFSRLLYAGRASLSLGVGVALVSVGLGGALGALAGFSEGWIDALVSLLIDSILSVPILALAMVASAFIDLTPWRLILILALSSWPTTARLVRGQVLQLKQLTYVEAAHAIGATRLRVLFRHIVPNTLGVVSVSASLLVAYAILIESALSFLGFGVPPPTATWGGMLYGAQLYYREAPWLAVFPGLSITLVVASINFLGEGLKRIVGPT